MPTEISKNYRWTRKWGGACSKKSFRVRKTKSGVLLRFCCPKGKFKKGQCHVAVKMEAMGRPKRKKKRGRSFAAYPLLKNIHDVKLVRVRR